MIKLQIGKMKTSYTTCKFTVIILLYKRPSLPCKIQWSNPKIPSCKILKIRCLNICFQFLITITRISIHFFTHVYSLMGLKLQVHVWSWYQTVKISWDIKLLDAAPQVLKLFRFLLLMWLVTSLEFNGPQRNIKLFVCIDYCNHMVEFWI